MAKKKTKTRKVVKNTKNLVKKEHKYTDEDKARLAKYQERIKRKPIKFKTVKSESDNLAMALKDPNDPLCRVKMLEALGTPDIYLQIQLLEQVTQTFKGIVSMDEFDNDKVVLACNNALSILKGIQPHVPSAVKIELSPMFSMVLLQEIWSAMRLNLRMQVFIQ